MWPQEWNMSTVAVKIICLQNPWTEINTILFNWEKTSTLFLTSVYTFKLLFFSNFPNTIRRMKGASWIFLIFLLVCDHDMCEIINRLKLLIHYFYFISEKDIYCINLLFNKKFILKNSHKVTWELSTGLQIKSATPKIPLKLQRNSQEKNWSRSILKLIHFSPS